jgi:hypothetical protein
MENKLPTMVDFVKLQKEKYIKINRTNEFACRVLDYVNFLSQQPNIGMFVPVVFEGGEWRVLEEPKKYVNICSNPSNELTKDIEFNYQVELEQYQTALDNVIFEGFQWNEKGYVFKNSIMFDEEFLENKTLEDLTKYNLTLTQKIAKELGL